MAIIYGVLEATKKLPRKLPKQINSLDEIKNVSRNLKEELNSIDDKGIGNNFNRWRKQRIINKI